MQPMSVVDSTEMRTFSCAFVRDYSGHVTQFVTYLLRTPLSLVSFLDERVHAADKFVLADSLISRGQCTAHLPHNASPAGFRRRILILWTLVLMYSLLFTFFCEINNCKALIWSSDDERFLLFTECKDHLYQSVLLLFSRPYGNKRCFCPSVCPSVCPSITYIANNSRTQRHSVPKFGRNVPHLRYNSQTSFKVKRSKVRVGGSREHTVSAEPGGHTACYFSRASLNVLWLPRSYMRLTCRLLQSNRMQCPSAGSYVAETILLHSRRAQHTSYRRWLVADLWLPGGSLSKRLARETHQGPDCK